MNFLRCLALQEKKKLDEYDDISRLAVVEIARVPDMLPNLFPSRQQGLRERVLVVLIRTSTSPCCSSVVSPQSVFICSQAGGTIDGTLERDDCS